MNTTHKISHIYATTNEPLAMNHHMRWTNYQNGEDREQCEVTVAGTDPSATRLKPVENGVVRTGIVGD